jgi:uncharacterized Zn-binding protein involved in type VI secretion
MRYLKLVVPFLMTAACGGGGLIVPPGAPTVSSTVPANTGADIAINLPISATFSRPMNPATVSVSTFLLKEGSVAVPGAVSYTGNTATLTPASPLAGSATFTATVTTGSKDPTGMALAADYSWTFTTVAVGALPAVSDTAPANAAANILPSQILGATFNEAMDPTTLTTSTFTVMQGSASVAGQVSYQAASNTATFTPVAPLGASLSYTATISTAATSALGRSLAAAYSWTFTTLPTGAVPTILATTPLNSAVNVWTGQQLGATFNVAMDAATLTTSTFTVMQGSTSVGGQVSYQAGSNTATFTPAVPLGNSLLYTAKISAGAKSASGSSVAAAYSWSFTTVAVGAPPDVSATTPPNGAVKVWTGQRLGATFNEVMDPTTLTALTFTVMQGSTSVLGQVSYQAASNTATFSPAALLGASLPYTATISTGAKNASGTQLGAAYSWSFTTRAAASGDLPVNLGTAGNYVILGESKISTVPKSAITGNVAISPMAASFITGFSLIADSTKTFSTSSQVTGKVYAADYTAPTSSNLTTAITDMGTAFTDAAGRAPDVTELGAGNIGGMTLAAGVYKWGTGLLIPTDVHLVGSATDVWVFEIAQDLKMSSATSIFLSGGALAKNVFWQVSGLVDLGTTAHCEGIILCQTGITLRTGASINGRLLAQTAVIVDGSTIVAPAP